MNVRAFEPEKFYFDDAPLDMVNGLLIRQMDYLFVEGYVCVWESEEDIIKLGPIYFASVGIH